MVQRCCVPLCETKVGEVDVKGAKVRFHRIPLTPEKFIKWRNQITNVGFYKPEPELTVNSRICSKHFLRTDYITDEEQKPGTAGNHVLAKDAFPTIFKWNDETNATLSRAIPFVKKADLQNTINGLSVKSKSQEVQCSLEEEKLKQELYRKNIVIRQLLQRLGELEEQGSGKEEKFKGEGITSLRRPNDTSQDFLQPNREITPLRTHSPEMPTLTPVPEAISVHGQELIVTNKVSSTYNVKNHVDISTQTVQNIQSEEGVVEVASNTCISQRVSVIKRVGRSVDRMEISKPPKKRKSNYFYGN